MIAGMSFVEIAVLMGMFTLVTMGLLMINRPPAFLGRFDRNRFIVDAVIDMIAREPDNWSIHEDSVYNGRTYDIYKFKDLNVFVGYWFTGGGAPYVVRIRSGDMTHWLKRSSQLKLWKALLLLDQFRAMKRMDPVSFNAWLEADRGKLSVNGELPRRKYLEAA